MKIMYVCTWPDSLDDFNPTDSSSTCFGAKTLYHRGGEIVWHTHRRDTLLYKLCRKLPQIDPIFAQISCIKQARKYDVIYIGFDMHLLPLCLAKWIGILKTPAFVVSHFMYNTQYANSKLKKLFIKFERWLVYRTIDKISFASPNLLSVAQQDYNVPKRHLNTCYWGANMHYFDSTKFSGPARRDIYIGVGGTNRDYDTLTQAFSGMSNCKCEIYAKYNNTNKARVLPDNLAFVNLMTGHTMNDAFKLLRDKYYHCKAVLIPIKTINDVPNGATVLVEALAMGRPVIITKSATNYIDVEKEGIGLTVEQGDVNGWINAVTYLENHPEELKAMSLRAYEFAVKHYNDDNFSKIIYLQMADTVRPK